MKDLHKVVPPKREIGGIWLSFFQGAKIVVPGQICTMAPWDSGGVDTSEPRDVAAAVRVFRDYRGIPIRLTDERLAHILEHPEMASLEEAIEETLSVPDRVMTSVADPDARLYYRRYRATPVGDKLLCVVVKTADEDGFVLTAYLTDRIKRGVTLWPVTR